MKKIAACIVTYNRDKAVEETCLKLLGSLDERYLDLYVYDSSDNYRTQVVIENYTKTYKNLFYCHMDSNIHSSQKVYQIYQEKKMQEQYAYLWILPDYLAFSEEVMEQCLEKIDEEYDMIMLDFYDYQNRGNLEYTDKNKIFLNYAWALTQYGILMLNCNSVLKNCAWSYLSKKYLQPNYRNFSHVTMYFEQMLQIKDFRFYHISVPMRLVYYSSHKGKTRYFHEFLDIWGDYWPKSMYALPAYYKEKERAIKNLSTYTGYLGKTDLLELRVNKVLTKKMFFRLVKHWKIISSASVGTFFYITFLPMCLIKGSIKVEHLKNQIKASYREVELTCFCRKFKEIYIYGAGVRAERCAEYLDRCHIEYQAFLVTHLQKETEIKGHKVLEFSKEIPFNYAGIIVAVSEKYQKEIIPLLEENGFGKRIFTKNMIVRGKT